MKALQRNEITHLMVEDLTAAAAAKIALLLYPPLVGKPAFNLSCASRVNG